MAKILLVEDNQNLANALAQLLPTFGHHVRVVHDGPQALSEAARSVPDTVLLDLGLPTLDGREVARRLRRMCGDGLRLVAYTAWTDITPREVADAGFDEILVKPASLDRLLKAVKA